MAGLRDQHAIVTGGGRGIGAAVAEALARAEARVTLMGRSRDPLQAQAEKLRGDAEVQAIEADVAAPESVKRAFARAEEGFGPAAILINNAGQAASAPFQKTDMALWRRLLDVNLTGTFLCAQAVLPGMLQAGYGRIVNIASIAGLAGAPYVAAYCAAKHGVIGLTRALALEFARKNITVNAVCPGYTETDMVSAAVANIIAKTGRSAEEAKAELVRRNPQGRLVQPQEVANAVLWLCLPGSESITGQAISISGGEVM
ncbi:MAG TPA: SDR family NAD(P)-dependent oxidoreductase [Xanthobacteraceae bacterium]|nr:SDR family NAD(P)-dependent oxidoreductase [Xanthobacteraceae bacterium]